MPTNEQIIKDMRKNLQSTTRGGMMGVFENDGQINIVTAIEEAATAIIRALSNIAKTESVAIDPKPGLAESVKIEAEKNAEFHRGFSAGKASLQPFDTDKLTTIFTQNGFKDLKPAEQAKVIADGFAAPEQTVAHPNFDRDVLAEILRDSGWGNKWEEPDDLNELTANLAEYFAAPQPKRERITITRKQAKRIYHDMLLSKNAKGRRG